jgi:hypothetical protein
LKLLVLVVGFAFAAACGTTPTFIAPTPVVVTISELSHNSVSHDGQSVSVTGYAAVTGMDGGTDARFCELSGALGSCISVHEPKCARNQSALRSVPITTQLTLSGIFRAAQRRLDVQCT